MVFLPVNSLFNGSILEIFSVLLILGGDIVGRALAQLSGGRLGPPSLSFGWVSYSINALVSAIGENKLMPAPDCKCIIINGENGYNRANSSWILGRVNLVKSKAKAKELPEPAMPTQAGLCVSIYRPAPSGKFGELVYDEICFCGYVIAILQFGIASIPFCLFDDWSVLMTTACGIILSCVTASLPQWQKGKWACRRLPNGTDKKVILTRGNGSQHAIVILGTEGFLDLEDISSGQGNVDVSTSNTTRLIVIGLALLWILLLITASGITRNAVGGVGILQNIYVAGRSRNPRAFGIPIDFKEVIGNKDVMKTLYAVEKKYPRLGRNMLSTFFQIS